MTLWRISSRQALDGAGGLWAPGRWHNRGRRIVYCAPNPATALVEVLVHLEIDATDVPDPLQYLEIEAPNDLSVETLDRRGNLQDTRRAGDEWLGSGRTALLRVPSVVVPETWNVLINPRHPESDAIRLVRTHRHSLDARLLR